MSTQESRGIEISWACRRSAEKRAIMMASDRPSGSMPFARWPRVSDPTSRNETGERVGDAVDVAAPAIAEEPQAAADQHGQHESQCQQADQRPAEGARAP